MQLVDLDLEMPNVIEVLNAHWIFLHGRTKSVDGWPPTYEMAPG